MPWKVRVETVEEKRASFAQAVLSGQGSKSALCRAYGISRPTGDKWLLRYVNREAMENRSKKPHHSPGQTSAEVEGVIVATRRKYPAIGAVKLHKMLENEGIQGLPSSRTMNNIFHRHHLITSEASLSATPHQRFEKAMPNEMWQGDYKGHFALGNQCRCHPLNIIDDCTRFNLCCQAQAGETLEEIRPVMIRLFQEYGLPGSFLCDNGNPWGTVQSTGFSRFEVWLMELGVLTLHGRIRHPQTQGKEESFNRSLTRELLKYHDFFDLQDAQGHFDAYRHFYNHIRPHHALNLETPASRYQCSPCKMPSQISNWEYPMHCDLRRVKSSGYLTYGGQGYFLSEAFGDKEVAVAKSEDECFINVYFRQFHIARIDPAKRIFTFKRAYLINGDPRNRDLVQQNAPF